MMLWSGILVHGDSFGLLVLALCFMAKSYDHDVQEAVLPVNEDVLNLNENQELPPTKPLHLPIRPRLSDMPSQMVAVDRSQQGDDCTVNQTRNVYYELKRNKCV